MDASKGNYGISDVLNSVIKDETFFSIYYPVYSQENKLIGAINGVLYPIIKVILSSFNIFC